MRLPDPARSQVILIGTAEYGVETNLLNLPAVTNNLDDLHTALADSTHGWLTPRAGTKILDPASPDRLGITIAEQTAHATDLVLIYYAGHGLLSPRGELYLATSLTNRERLRFTGFPFDGIREILDDSPAANRVVILDCCYSGRAIAAMSDPQSIAYDQLDITGTYILTSTTATTISHAPDGARHTAFTGELIKLLRSGDPDAPELITLNHIYRAIHRSLIRQGLPRPQQRGSDATPHLALVRNHAFDHLSLKTESSDLPPAAQLPAVAASTSIPVDPDRRVAERAGGHPAAQASYPRALHRQRPTFSSDIAAVAMVLCTGSCLLLAASGIRLFNGHATIYIGMPPWGFVLIRGVWAMGDILLFVGTTVMWCRRPVGRILAIIGLSVVIAPMLGAEIAAWSTSYYARH